MAFCQSTISTGTKTKWKLYQPTLQIGFWKQWRYPDRSTQIEKKDYASHVHLLLTRRSMVIQARGHQPYRRQYRVSFQRTKKDRRQNPPHPFLPKRRPPQSQESMLGSGFLQKSLEFRFQRFRISYGLLHEIPDSHYEQSTIS